MIIKQDIPIPRKGIYWGIQQCMPPEHGEEIYIIHKPHEEFSEPEELVIFDHGRQALTSIWLMGFSYAQMLKLFTAFETVQDIRNAIFPKSLEDCNIFREELRRYYPRQLVDSEYIAIVKAIGIPDGKIKREVYQNYMNWVNAVNDPAPFWLKPRTSNSEYGKKILARIEKKKAKIKVLQDEIDKLEEKIVSDKDGY